MDGLLRRISLLGGVVLAITLVALHVCVLPGHVEAVQADDGQGHAHGALPHERGGHEGDVHDASCDAVRVAQTVTTAAPVVTHVVSFSPTPVSRIASVTRPLPVPASPPPLFLLHASLLI